MTNPQYVYVKVFQPENEDIPYVWVKVDYEKIWSKRIHDVEWKRKPPRGAIVVGE